MGICGCNAGKISKNSMQIPPTWDLSGLYSSINDSKIKADFTALEKGIYAFKAAYSGKIDQISGDLLAKAVAEYEEIVDLSGRLSSYAYLLFAENSENQDYGAFYQNTMEAITALDSEILFFALAINKLSDADFNDKLNSAKLAHYRSWLDNLRVMKPHQLADELEKLLLEKSVSGRSAWMRLFDELQAGLRFNIDGKELTESEAFNLLSGRDAAVRKLAAEEISRVLGANIKTFSLITNTLAKDKQDDDRWRKFKHPISSRNLSNLVEDEVVDALLAAVKQSYPDLSHRYYAWKAKHLGMEKMNFWDRNAPLSMDEDRTINWDDAKEIVLTSYNDFSPTIAGIAKEFFDKNWIDAQPRKGKSGGAFSHPTVPSAHPYILMNYHGKVRDVMTLAHELGHGVHQVLSARQGALMADTPLTVAETASVFGEQLTFRALLKREPDANKRKLVLAGKIEDMLNTVVRQVAFCEFERLLHDERKNGELSPERIGELWMQVQRESLGDSFTFTPDYALYWSYIPHFVHTPFYVYAYAFGDLLVNALYQVYSEGFPNFEQKYIELLKAGGTLRHKQLLEPFGLDASKPDFWLKGIKVISGMIDELQEK